jgi:hypothetical protein
MKYGIYFNGVIKDNSFHNLSFVGIHFVADTKNKVLQLKPDVRFGKGAMVAGLNVDGCIDAWEKLNSTKLSSSI